MTLSLVEDLVAICASVLMAYHPLIVLAIVVLFVIVAALVARRVIVALGKLFHRTNGGRGRNGPASAYR